MRTVDRDEGNLERINSYGSLRVVWAPPEREGDSPVSHYAWVEYVGGVPVLTGDAVPRHGQRERERAPS